MNYILGQVRWVREAQHGGGGRLPGGDIGPVRWGDVRRHHHSSPEVVFLLIFGVYSKGPSGFCRIQIRIFVCILDQALDPNTYNFLYFFA